MPIAGDGAISILEQVPKKLTDFFDKNLLQRFERTLFLTRPHDFARLESVLEDASARRNHASIGEMLQLQTLEQALIAMTIATFAEFAQTASEMPFGAGTG